MVDFDLPRKDETTGRPKISYSQITAFRDSKCFNQIFDSTGKLKTISGAEGYVLRYMANYDFPSTGMDIYGEWGVRVERGVLEQEYTGFDSDEIKIMKSVTPVGLGQYEFKLNMGKFDFIGFIDDTNKETAEGVNHPLYLNHIRDYKTASLKSGKKYREDSYLQTDMYSLAKYLPTGKLPEITEVVMFEREGSHLNMPMKLKGVHYIPRSINVDRLIYAQNVIMTTAKEISRVYCCWKQINGYR